MAVLFYYLLSLKFHLLLIILFLLKRPTNSTGAVERALTNLFSTEYKDVELARLCIQHELDESSDENTLFRGNTSAIKVLLTVIRTVVGVINLNLS